VVLLSTSNQIICLVRDLRERKRIGLCLESQRVDASPMTVTVYVLLVLKWTMTVLFPSVCHSGKLRLFY
jgi:hypothetical protein